MTTEPPSRMPQSIPSVPALALSYDDIDQREAIGSGGNADVDYARATTRVQTFVWILLGRAMQDGELVCCREARIKEASP